MKGIILAAGKGTRLYPASIPVTKGLLPVYDKPMVYYPLCTLMQAGIRDFLIVSNKDSMGSFEALLGDGSQFGVKIQYDIQNIQRGIADVFLLAERYIDGDDVALILGDNIFHGDSISLLLKDAVKERKGATIFGYPVEDPERFGVVEFDESGNVLSLEEKPTEPRSNYAVVGLYFYDSRVCDFAKKLTPSARGELEITDLNKLYLNDNSLNVKIMPGYMKWFDAGTFDSMMDASRYVQDEWMCGKTVSCPEEVALGEGFVSSDDLVSWVSKFNENGYYAHIKKIINH